MSGNIEISITIVNADALEAFEEVREIIETAAEDQPWNSELERCVTLLVVVADGMDIAQSEDET